MARFDSQQGWASALSALILAASVALLAGCGTETAPVTAANSQFRPAGEADATGGGDSSSESTAAAPESGPLAGLPATSPKAGTPKTPGKTAQEAAGSAGEASSDGSDSGVAVAGEIGELVAYIDQLARQQPKGDTQQAMIEDFLTIQMTRLEAAKRVLALKPDIKTKRRVIGAAMEIYAIFHRAGMKGAADQRLAFAQQFVQDADPEIARNCRYVVYDANLGKILSGEPLQDGKPIVAQIKSLLESDPDGITAETLELASGSVELLRQQGFQEDAAAAYELIAASAATDPKFAEQAEQMKIQAKLARLDVTGSLLVDVLMGEPDAETKLLAAVEKLIQEAGPSRTVFSEVREVAYRLEIAGKNQASLKCLELVDAAFKEGDDRELADIVGKAVANARIRLGLIGQPFAVEGVLLDGQPFDWSAYAGKVVLVDFWATWCGPCIEELPNIRKNYELFHDLGFEVVGVNMDVETEQVVNFLTLQPLPWTSVASPEALGGKVQEPWELPMAVKNGVDSLPFLVLVGKDGKVDSLHVRRDKLKKRLTELLGPPPGEKPTAVPADPTAPAKPPGEEPTAEKPAETPPADKPAAEPPAAEKPAEKPAEKSGALAPRGAASPVAVMLAQAVLAAEDKPAPEEKPAEEKPTEKQAPVPPPTADDPAINPYKAKPGLTNAQLLDYIDRMLDKPKSIRSREGFTEAVVEACDRVLNADPPAKEVEYFVAAESKCDALHRKACAGDAACDKQLLEFVAQLKPDERPRLARQVEFFERERRVLGAAELPVDQLPPLLKELQDYYTKEKLTARHLRMASSTVGLINKLADGDQREEYFASFGNAFAKAGDKELARYGKKLAKKPGAVESDLVGKPLELVGTTSKGANFVWDAYRGKVVVVDFWATWCGPCRQEMPNVIAFHEKHRDAGFDVVGISLDQDLEALDQYLDENQIPWDTLSGDGTQELAEKYGVRGIPTMMLVDREGKVVAVAHSLSALAPAAEKLLQAQK